MLTGSIIGDLNITILQLFHYFLGETSSASAQQISENGNKIALWVGKNFPS
jgi:hypothetical protein